MAGQARLQEKSPAVSRHTDIEDRQVETDFDLGRIADSFLKQVSDPLPSAASIPFRQKYLEAPGENLRESV